MGVPEVYYARSGDIAIAYQVIGDGPVDVVFIRGIAGDLLSTWEQPLLVRHVKGLAECGRVLMIDRRGSGLSDRIREVQSLETAMDDIRAVMDDVGSDQAVFWSGHTATGIGVLFAATYPDRCAALILVDPRVKGTRSSDYPWAPSADDWRQQLAAVRDRWGRRDYFDQLVRDWAPAKADDEEFRDWFTWHMRRSLSPGAALTAFRAAMNLDVREVLPALRVPTLVLAGNEPGPAHFASQQIHGAELVGLPNFQGVYTWVADNVHSATISASREFISRHAVPRAHETVLVTLLFTDIVGSTDMLARLGDAAWRDLVEQHHAVVRRVITRHRGKEVDTAGDGFFATFDGPARAVRAAVDIDAAVAPLGMSIRAGLHTGECEITDGKVAGIAVSTAARICALAGPHEVLVSSTVKELVAGSELRFTDRGEHTLKGIPEPRRIFGFQQ
jgi:class 3 adenylate cyclase